MNEDGAETVNNKQSIVKEEEVEEDAGGRKKQLNHLSIHSD